MNSVHWAATETKKQSEKTEGQNLARVSSSPGGS